jgi:hypothetical protein
MATRKVLSHDTQTRSFYVYMFCQTGTPIYVGKGSKQRFKNQVKRFVRQPNTIGGIVRYFASEKAAYNFECRLIAKHKPKLNVNKGGGGAITRVGVKKLPAGDRAHYAEMTRIGTHAYCARLLLRVGAEPFIGASKVDALGQVAYGAGC